MFPGITGELVMTPEEVGAYPLGARPGHVAAAALAAVGLGRCALFLGAFTGQGMR